MSGRRQILLALTLAWLGACRENGSDVPSAPTQLPESASESAPEPVAEKSEPVAENVSETLPGTYAQICAACHGPAGEGNALLEAPSIAGLPEWYSREQIEKFRSGARGSHPEDLPGLRMRAIALALDESQIATAAASVALFAARPTTAPAESVELESGRYLYANRCMECHRYNGRGEIAFRSPPLISLNPAYLARQLRNFRDGRRGSTEGDLYGAKMVEVTRRLGDKEIDQIVDYLGALAHGDDPRMARER